jgi:hypothetical protein
MIAILKFMGSLSFWEVFFVILSSTFIISLAFGAARDFYRKLLLGVQDKKYVPTSFYKKQAENLKKIWNNDGYRDFGVERLVRLALQLLAFIMPAGVIRWATGGKNLLFRKIGIEAYAIGKVIFAWQAIMSGWTANGWITIIIIILTIDTLHFLIGRIVLNDIWRQPISFQRSLIMTLVNYVEFCICFAAVYYYWDHAHHSAFNTKDLQSSNYIYFSFVTAATIGYGDIFPIDPFLQKVINTQIMISLFMVVVIIANVANKVHEDTFYNERQRKQDKKDDKS